MTVHGENVIAQYKTIIHCRNSSKVQ